MIAVTSPGSAYQARVYAGNVAKLLSAVVVSNGQTKNDNLTSISGISLTASGLILDTSGTFTAANLSGDATSSGAVLTLKTVNSNVGTYQGLTVNGKGLVTGAANLYTSTPLHPTSTGSQGQWSSDSTYIYFCIGTNSWVRTLQDLTWS